MDPQGLATHLLQSARWPVRPEADQALPYCDPAQAGSPAELL